MSVFIYRVFSDIAEGVMECMPEWLETVAKYNDPEVDLEDVWGCDPLWF